MLVHELAERLAPVVADVGRLRPVAGREREQVRPDVVAAAPLELGRKSGVQSESKTSRLSQKIANGFVRPNALHSRSPMLER